VKTQNFCFANSESENTQSFLFTIQKSENKESNLFVIKTFENKEYFLFAIKYLKTHFFKRKFIAKNSKEQRSTKFGFHVQFSKIQMKFFLKIQISKDIFANSNIYKT
jgi:hypothetical protein